ncbi:MAG: YjbQ family protein [Methanomassiliicoccus sp.]|nr:YjbQ family protein [Methanomassiliicoccus sp.]
MGSFRKVLNIRTELEGDIVDLTEELTAAVRESLFKEGLACVFVGHSTAALFTIENEEGLRRDMKEALQRLFPKEMDYDHHRRWGDGNGHSHIRSAFLGTSLTIPFHDGVPDLGTWQQVVLMELDNRGRDRKVIFQIIGDQ